MVMNTSFEPKTKHPKRRASHEDNQSAVAYPSRTIVRAKLEMTESGDQEEQEADAVANAVVSGGQIARKISDGGGSSGIAVPRQMESRLMHSQGGGQPMPSGLRSMMEGAFGLDFQHVRLHTGPEAASMSDDIHAKAFTLGEDIYFNRDQFSPDTLEGQRLVAHELTHVVQGGRKIARERKDTGVSGHPRSGDPSDDVGQMIERYEDNYFLLMHRLSDFIMETDFQVTQLDEELHPRSVMVAVEGGAFIGPPETIEAMMRGSKMRRVLAVMDNMRGGLFGSLLPGLSMMFGMEDPERIYQLSQLGAAIDASATAVYGETTAKNRTDLVPKDPLIKTTPETYGVKTGKRGGAFAPSPYQVYRSLEQSVRVIRKRTFELRTTYQMNMAESNVSQSPEHTVSRLIIHYGRILSILDRIPNASSSQLYKDMIHQSGLLAKQQIAFRKGGMSFTPVPTAPMSSQIVGP